MSNVEHITVTVEDDFLARQTKAQPLQALAELIWNSLDAEASRVSVEFDYNDLAGGLSKIVVYDDGHAFPREKAAELFGHLGGSWKRFSRTTKEKNRMVHGQEGRGRYKAFALGQSAVWKVCYQLNGHRKAYEISLDEGNLKNVAITPERDAPEQPVGVIVQIQDIKKDFRSFSSQSGLQELSEIFAIYLSHYKDVSVSIGNERLEPSTAIANQKQIGLPPFTDEDGKEYAAELEIVEWRSDTKRTLYLCSEAGFPLEQVETRFHIPQFSFSAYLKSSYITTLHNEGRLSLIDMAPLLRGVVDQARESIKDYFRERASERARTVVDEWKAEDIYPYQGEATNVIEKAERQVFDIVAVSVQDFAPDLQSAAPKAKALHLRMLRQAIERSPDDLQTILNEVLQLPERKKKELAELLQETSLSAIITAAKTVADRLKFITGLENILFDPEKKGRLKERSQLHKILAENTWLFGEEYHLWASDRDLKRVLEKHREHLDPDIVIDDPVKVIGKKRGIVDLMLSRSMRRHRANDIEHLIIELKAPSVVVGDETITQAKRYAIAVSKDERFHTVKGIRWHFWIISNQYNEFAKEQMEGGPDPLRQLVHRKENITVGIKTWGEIIEENRARLQFFQEHLQHSADESSALQFLQERHRKFLEGVVENDDSGEEPYTDVILSAVESSKATSGA
jgi:hypothetical protein